MKTKTTKTRRSALKEVALPAKAGEKVVIYNKNGVLVACCDSCRVRAKQYGGGWWKCPDCEMVLRRSNGAGWVEEYDLQYHLDCDTPASNLVKWLSFWSGYSTRTLGVTVHA
jgi:hypothetical protein